MTRWSLLSCVGLAFAAAPALGQSGIPDPSVPQENAAPASAAADPLQGQGQRIKALVAVGANSGIDPGTSFTFQTGKGTVVINTVAEKSPEAPAKAGPPAADHTPALVAAALLIFAASILVRRRAPAPAPAAAAEALPFTIVRAIGEGGMGVVYEAVDRTLDRRVAVKKLRAGAQDDIDGLQSLVKEAKTVAALHHPNIVDIYGVSSQGGEYYLVFELIEGRTVSSLLKERGRLTFKETRAILDPVCRALEFAHGRGVVHRDLKPANVMITAHGQIKVMDFGIARSVRRGAAGGPAAPVPLPDAALTNIAAGTPVYAAPESKFGLIVPQSDVYALGVMTYQLLSGSLPFDAQQGLETGERRYDPLSKLTEEAPPAIDALIAQSLEADPQKRLASPRQFRERLSAL